MLDFLQVSVKAKNKVVTIRPNFISTNQKDLMVRGGAFYAVWDEETGMWSQNEYDVFRLVDEELRKEAAKYSELEEVEFSVAYIKYFNSNSLTEYKNYIRKLPDSYVQLDSQLTFKSDKTAREDYASKRLPYDCRRGPHPSWDKLVSKLYSFSEREKIEWAIGSIVSGDSVNLQKFFVFFGDPGTGKSTIMNIISDMFPGYTTVFDAKSLVSANNQFSAAQFKDDPLIGIQQDGDLSRISDNSKLNSIVSHEKIIINEKYKSGYVARTNCLLFMGSNKPVYITDAKAGVLRRLIDIHPTGAKFSPEEYSQLMERIKFEYGAIAHHCRKVYEELGPAYYDAYRPLDMVERTDMFYNFVQDHYSIFNQEDGVTLQQAYKLFKEYCTENGIDRRIPKYQFRDELRNYFYSFVSRDYVDGVNRYSIFKGFRTSKFEAAPLEKKKEKKKPERWIKLEKIESLFDRECSDCQAQYGDADEKPFEKWSSVKKTLADISTDKLHYVRVPKNHIVVDFDLKDETGAKSLDRNLEAAEKFPQTYAELSKGGAGLHLHYIYDGDVDTLSRVYSEGIEVKVFSGKSSLRRRLSQCNNIPIAHINSGLPQKEPKKMINTDSVKSERSLRVLIERNLRKEIHPGTKPSVDFIHKILEDAYSSELHYDVTDLRPKVLGFAMGSTNHRDYCVTMVSKMKFKSNEPSQSGEQKPDDDRLVFFDVEVFPNLFLINWKFQGDEKCVRMINPSPAEVEALFKFKLVGYNCRRYDNHICYARTLGYNNEELFRLSQRLISKDSRSQNNRNAFFGEAYNISYTDVYDFASASNKKSLKKWEIELELHHMELGLPWDKPVPEEQWAKVAEYCDNDVISTEKVFEHLKGDWAARQILAELSGLSVNDTTNQHSTRIIFGNEKHPQGVFNYTDLSEMFPGYKFERGKSTYRGEETGEGGYIYAEPGVYVDVVLLDIASMHPSSIEALNLFGPYTKRFSDLKMGRLSFKHEDPSGLERLLDGKLVSFFKRAKAGEYSFKDVANALKTVINSVYGLTSAKFDNPFRDIRNKDNIVAKRGALFMIDLKHAIQEKGYKVIHIKTDSVKIANADKEIIDFVMEFGKKYGYEFEHEDTYSKIALVNDAVYIARYSKPKIDKETGEEIWWTATGAQFAVPYVFKTLFSHQKIEFKDLCETKSASTALYLDMVENASNGEHDYQFVGKVGSFCPILEGCGGGDLLRSSGEGTYAYAGGAKGYRWLESEYVRDTGLEEMIDRSYFRKQVDAAVETISKYADFEWFVSDDLVAPWEKSDFKAQEDLPF